MKLLAIVSIATFLVLAKAQSYDGAQAYTAAYEGDMRTYDWGQHTPPPDGNNNQNDGHHSDNEGQGDQDGHMWQHRCGGGQWTCAGAANLCVDIRLFCNGVKNCPGGEDEDATVCRNSLSHQKPDKGNGKPNKPNNGNNGNGQAGAVNVNRFRGQGFMWHIKNIKIAASQAKIFNQDSDRVVQAAN